MPCMQSMYLAADAIDYVGAGAQEFQGSDVVSPVCFAPCTVFRCRQSKCGAAKDAVSLCQPAT